MSTVKIMKNKKNRRIFFIFIQHCIPLLLCVSLLGFGAVGITTLSIQTKNEQQSKRLLAQTVTYFDLMFDELDTIYLMFCENSEMLNQLKNILKNDYLSYDDYQSIKLLKAFISAPVNAKQYINSIYIYMNNEQGNILVNTQGIVKVSTLTNVDIQSEVAKLQGKSYLVERIESTDLKPSYIRLVRRISRYSGGGKGLIIIDLKSDIMVQKYLEKFLERGETLSVDLQNGDNVFQLSNNVSATQNNMIYYKDSLPKYSLYVTLGVNKKIAFEISFMIIKYTLLLSLFSLFLGAYLTYRTNKKERLFLQNVMDQLTVAGDGTIVNSQTDAFTNVYDYLNYHVLKTFLEQDYLRYKNEAMEYRALQMQMNPHFLFNTLDTIYWKTLDLTGGENDSSLMISLLSKELKYALEYHGRRGVPIDREIAQTEYYVQLQKHRFGNRFQLRWDIEPDIKGLFIPALSFQPLLENAFSHGLKEREIVTIIVSIQVDSENLILTVKNNGLPIDEAELITLNDDRVDPLSIAHNFGIANTRKRFSLFTNNQSQFSIENTDAGFVCVTICIPLIYTKKRRTE